MFNSASRSLARLGKAVVSSVPPTDAERALVTVVPHTIQPRNSRFEIVNLRAKLAAFGSHWDPRIIGELNGPHVKLAKLQGEFVWHAQEFEDELFLVLGGSLEMRFRDRVVTVREGELVIVPRGVECGAIVHRDESLEA